MVGNRVANVPFRAKILLLGRKFEYFFPALTIHPREEEQNIISTFDLLLQAAESSPRLQLAGGQRNSLALSIFSPPPSLICEDFFRWPEANSVRLAKVVGTVSLPPSSRAEAKSIAKEETCLSSFLAQATATNECGSGPGRHQSEAAETTSITCQK